jgi:hypothetical protein
LAPSEKLSPAGVLLKSFAKSNRHGADAYKMAVQLLVTKDDQQQFESLFGSVFEPVDWNNLSQVVDLNRILDSRWKSLNYRSLYAKSEAGEAWQVGEAGEAKQTSDVKKLTQAEWQELEHLSTKLQFIATKFAPVLKGPRPVGVKLDLRSVDLWTGDFQGADLSGANLSDADLTALDLKGANLTGITEYQRAAFVGTAWWQASRIGKGLLAYLVKTYPYDRHVAYGSSQETTEPDYRAQIYRLGQSASSP